MFLDSWKISDKGVGRIEKPKSVSRQEETGYIAAISLCYYHGQFIHINSSKII